MTEVAIEVEFSHCPPNGGAERWRVYHQGEVLLASCRIPLYDGARALLGLGGFDPDDTIVTIHKATGMRCLTARIGWAAAMTITEGERSGPRLVPWIPYTGPLRKDED